MKIVVGARKSPLALAECKFVAGLLTKAGADVELRPVETVVDSIEVALKEGAGSEVFVREVDEALARGDIDVAVHDMKDVGPKLPKNLSIAAVPARDEAREAYVSTRASRLGQLGKGGRIGVTDPQSHVQISKVRSDLAVVPMPPDIEGLLRALKEGELEAFLVAACDLRRMGFQRLIAELVDVDRIVPPIGQGALAVEVRGAERDLMKFVSRACHNNASGLRVRAERSFLKEIEGAGGRVFGAYAEIKPAGLAMIGFVSTLDGAKFFVDRENGELDKVGEIGKRLAEKLLKKFGA